MWVGIVERALIAGAIVLGRPELMAGVVAVKGLGRSAGIKSSAVAGERGIIGTFVSIALSSLVAVLGWDMIVRGGRRSRTAARLPSWGGAASARCGLGPRSRLR